MPVSYYNQLKAQLLADSTAKKAAIDARLAAYTQASFDASGNLSYKEPGKLGTRDVQYDTDTRNIKASGESSGMLRSGQQARNLATNLASYKADVLGASGQATADKGVVDTDSATELAKYQATYGTGSSNTTSNTTSTKKDETPSQAPIAPAPTLNTPIPSQSTVGLSPSRIASEYKVPGAPSQSTVGLSPSRIASEYKAPATTPKASATPAKAPATPPKTPATPPKAPVTPKKTTVTPKRIGGY